jgi:uncharacterized membrane protein YdbT with pleckstrin-like domain
VGYTEQSLITGESILYRTGLHWITLLGPMFLAGIFLLSGTSLLIAGYAGAGLALGGFGTIVIALAVMARNATEMAVTSKRVVVKVGLLRRRTVELSLSRVESVIVEQGLLGRMLGYGSIVVRGTGGTAEPFRTIRSPLEFRRAVQQHSEELTTA